MEKNWASDHLHTIRTLMERSALYRRALAPVMIAAGVLGMGGAAVTHLAGLESTRAFSLAWLGIGAVTVCACFLLVRRQALKDSEPLLSLPTRRIVGALTPCFLAGLAAGVQPWLTPTPPPAWLIAAVWITAYGCALHAAGFFMQRGIKLFGWLFVLAGTGLLLLGGSSAPLQSPHAAHNVMGSFFGALHLGYGVYLYFTEKARNRP